MGGPSVAPSLGAAETATGCLALSRGVSCGHLTANCRKADMEDLTSGAAHSIPMQNLQRQCPEASEECSLFKALPTYGATNSSGSARQAEDATAVADQRGSLAWDLSTMPYALAGVFAALICVLLLESVDAVLFALCVGLPAAVGHPKNPLWSLAYFQTEWSTTQTD